jgi:hypothetical protein
MFLLIISNYIIIRWITKDIYDKKHQEYHDKIQLLNIELEEHTKADYDYQTTVASVLSVARRAKSIFESSEAHEKRAFLNYLLQNPTVNGKKLEFTMRSPFNLVLELASSPNWLRRQDSKLTASVHLSHFLSFDSASTSSASLRIENMLKVFESCTRREQSRRFSSHFALLNAPNAERNPNFF